MQADASAPCRYSNPIQAESAYIAAARPSRQVDLHAGDPGALDAYRVDPAICANCMSSLIKPRCRTTRAVSS